MKSKQAPATPANDRSEAFTIRLSTANTRRLRFLCAEYEETPEQFIAESATRDIVERLRNASDAIDGLDEKENLAEAAELNAPQNEVAHV